MELAVSGLVARVESTGAFKDWRKLNGKAYLTSIFVMAKRVDDLGAANEWLLSYYDHGSDSFTTFSSITGRKSAGEEAFKKGMSLPELKLERVKVQLSGALDAAERLRLGKYNGEAVASIIVVLQPLSVREKGSRDSPVEDVWNITYITASFNVLNVKISAASGNVLTDSMSGVMDFMRKDK